MHTSVLLKEAVGGLNVFPGGKYIDATYGVGGHAREIVAKGGNVLALDWDEENVKVKNEELSASQRIKNEKKIKLVWGNFADIEKIAQENDFFPVDGILFDLGLSMEQIGGSGRGFSFKKLDEPLDMRISSSTTKTAASIIRSSNAEALYEILSRNSQEIDSGPISQAIFSAGRIRHMATVGDLVNVISSIQGLRNKKESVLRRLFQSLRIEVNDEMSNLEKGLEGALHVIKKGGVIAIITFHETEDRLVKKIALKNNVTFTTKKPITSSSGLSFEESAKLRIISC